MNSLRLLCSVALLSACGTPAPTFPCSSLPSTASPSSPWTLTGPTLMQRQTLLAAGGIARTIDDTYYIAWFPSSFASAPQRRVLVSLHGTAGAPEAEWNDFRSTLESRGWGFVGLAYYYPPTLQYSDDAAMYPRLNTALTDISAAYCLSGAKIFLTGFSRGSANVFPVAYRDRKGSRWFTGAMPISGAWPPDASGATFGVLPPTLAAIDSSKELGAYGSLPFWIYCGEQDTAQAGSSCAALANAQRFVDTYGGKVQQLFRDPSGVHGSFVKNSTAMSQAFDYLESL